MPGIVSVGVEMTVQMVLLAVPATTLVVIVIHMPINIVVANVVHRHRHQNLPVVSHLGQKLILKMGK